VNPAQFFSVESDTMGTLRVSGAISFENAARALTQVPHPRAGARNGHRSCCAGKRRQCDHAVLIAWAAAGQQARRDAALSTQRCRSKVA
jgi:hypothetical protein